MGVSILSGAHMTIFPEVIRLLKAKKAGHIKVFGGGIIPPDDVKKLKKLGVKEVFLSGTNTEDIIRFVKEKIAK